MIVTPKDKKRLTNIWIMARQRCRNPKATYYEYYGGRGINMTDDWTTANDFIVWALNNGYEENLSLDRIDGEAWYSPTNCRWTTKANQVRATRLLRKTNTSGYRGVCFVKSRNKYRAAISVNYKNIFLGYYNTALDASYAFDKYVILHKLENTLNHKD